MATTYQCDNCSVTAPSLAGWKMVSVVFITDDPNAPTPPGGRTQEAVAPDLIFHDVTCRDAWCTKAAVAPPPVTP